jgi:hypothetical protein
LERQLRRFRVNEPSVLFESFDEEIVAVNLDTGNYYSISKTGPMIWMDAVNGLSVEEIVDRVGSRYTGERDAIATEVGAFIDRLLSNELLVESSGVSPRRERTLVLGADRTQFVSPVIENYSDMQDLLMLDPIHDVDAAGWPVAKTNS